METRNIGPALSGAVVGGILTMIVGFTWGGWVTGGSAEAMAKKRADVAAVTALVPFCVKNFNDQPDAVVRLAELKAATSYQQGAFVADGGWATMPGSDKPNTDLASKCAEALTKPPAETAAG